MPAIKTYQGECIKWLAKQKPTRKFGLDEGEQDGVPHCPLAHFEAAKPDYRSYKTSRLFIDFFVNRVDALPNKSRTVTAARALKIARQIRDELKSEGKKRPDSTVSAG